MFDSYFPNACPRLLLKTRSYESYLTPSFVDFTNFLQQEFVDITKTITTPETCKQLKIIYTNKNKKSL